MLDQELRAHEPAWAGRCHFQESSDRLDLEGHAWSRGGSPATEHPVEYRQQARSQPSSPRTMSTYMHTFESDDGDDNDDEATRVSERRVLWSTNHSDKTML